MRRNTIKHGDIKTRDWLVVRLIQGATKSGVAKDRKKEANKKACRSWKRDR